MGRQAGGRGAGAAEGACTGNKVRLQACGAGARAERTENMPFMAVTLDVLKLGGWLNALVSCRVARGARMMRGEVRGREGRRN